MIKNEFLTLITIYGENLMTNFFWKIRPKFLPSRANKKKVFSACFQKSLKKNQKNKEKKWKKKLYSQNNCCNTAGNVILNGT